MNVIFILIAVSLLVAVGFLVSFIWSIRSGQYDDDYTPSVRILFDDEQNIINGPDEMHDEKNGNGLTGGVMTTEGPTLNPGTKNQEQKTN